MRASWVLISGCGAMYRCLEVSPGVRGWTPTGFGVASGHTVSPGVRGWTDVMAVVVSPVVGFPRRAGVDRSLDRYRVGPPGFPPVCGGGPISARRIRAARSGFPWCAGVDRSSKSCGLSGRWFPPVCGGGPSEWAKARRPRRVSPGVRGWIPGEIRIEFAKIGFPRCAGVDRSRRWNQRRFQSFPPACGGGPIMGNGGMTVSAFSPGVRGWTVGTGGRSCDLRVFPRRAGVDRCPGSDWRSEAGFPPACGGGPLKELRKGWDKEFSPGVRGWTQRDGTGDNHGGGFPRRAGVDPGTESSSGVLRRFPPACGGGPSLGPSVGVTYTFSPGVRGWTAGMAVGHLEVIVFPRRTGVDRAG